MTDNTELKWRNAALKHLLIGPGETRVLDAISTVLTRASRMTGGLLLSDLWIKGTKKRGRAGEVDHMVNRFVVTWGDTTVMTISPGGCSETIEDDQLVRGKIKSVLPPTDIVDGESFAIETLESAIERAGAAGAFDEKPQLKKIFEDALLASTNHKRLRL